MDHPISNKSNLNTSTSSSSSTWTLPTATAAAALSSSPPSDEISLFLQQILLRSSSSPTNNIRPFLTHTIIPHEISAVDSSSSHVLHDLTPTAPNNASSTSFDCHSDQEALLVQDLLPTTDPNNNNNPPPPPPRTSSKRCRASQFHNLSEKRRRGRINHKMKALQNLIPNSNKTDKAWMLDEAIEYLKHLQLQVQILSMRNGKTPFQLLPSVHPHITPFYFTPSSKEICTDVIQDHQVNLSQSQTTTPFVSRPYNIPVPDLQELQNCVTTLEHSHVFPSLFNGIDTGRSTETTEPQR